MTLGGPAMKRHITPATIIATVALFFFFSRYYIEGVSYAGVKG